METIVGISDIKQIQDLVRSGFRDWSKFGDVRAQYHHGMLMLSYTQDAQYAGRWNYFERVSRGLILDTTTGEIVARPFDKFFNWNEISDLSSHGAIAEVTEKLDGSLGILYRHRGEYRIATRGSFHSDQAVWATEFLRKHFDLTGLPDEYTLLFEIIYPGNRIVVDYQDREDIVLIGVRNRFTGEDYFFPKVVEVATKYGFNVPKIYSYNNINDIIELAKKSEDINYEGWVVRFQDGTRVKIKNAEYVKVHKLLFNLSFRQVLELWYVNEIKKTIECIPDELLREIKEWINNIESSILQHENAVINILREMPHFSTRKECVQWIRENHPNMLNLVLGVIDRRDITPFIIRNVFDIPLHHLRDERENKGILRIVEIPADITEKIKPLAQ